MDLGLSPCNVEQLQTKALGLKPCKAEKSDDKKKEEFAIPSPTYSPRSFSKSSHMNLGLNYHVCN